MTSEPTLTPNEILALVVLMVEARELTNNELKALAGFALTGAQNTKLVKAGLVETNRSHRPFSHQLTEKGWRVVRELHTVAPPKAGGSAIRSLFTVLGGLDRALDRRGISYADFFAGSATGAAPVDAESQLRSAYQNLASKPGEWVGLADLRAAVPQLDREDVDAALRAMARVPGVRIIPTANSKSLDNRDRAAALRLGGEDNHMISIGAA
ncbi:hypothetical protein GCM10009682_36490 [Luedemannella flava]|uniref:MarR family transcriptional regulator n=1 Tax=Luedemannella flava TaxID=349316 RepID=A0ABP4YJD8_9ACTN